MNPSVSQCKNCWKLRYTTFICHIYGSKCQKYNGLHKLKHYKKMMWCCKANFKTNPSRLKIKK